MLDTSRIIGVAMLCAKRIKVVESRDAGVEKDGDPCFMQDGQLEVEGKYIPRKEI